MAVYWLGDEEREVGRGALQLHDGVGEIAGRSDVDEAALHAMIAPDEDGDTPSNTELSAIAEADEWLKHNQPIAHEEVLAEFGLTVADWEKMGDEPPRRNG